MGSTKLLFCRMRVVVNAVIVVLTQVWDYAQMFMFVFPRVPVCLSAHSVSQITMLHYLSVVIKSVVPAERT